MIKKILIELLLLLGMIPIFVQASTTAAAKVGDKYYETLEEAIANASSTDTIMLTSNAVLEDTLLINKTVNIDLNGHDIIAPTKVFQVQGGTLNISGEGTIKETEPNYGAIMIKGSTDATDINYSVVNIGKDVTLEGWAGIFIAQESSKAYGVVVNLDGKINAVDDTSGGSGIGVYVNGNIQHQNNSPVVNISDSAQITSTGNGLYLAGYSTFNIGKATITGIESGIGMKSGILNMNGTTVTGTGKDATPTEGYNNGIYASGTAIQIESNTGYAGNMEINIKSGNFKSKNSNVIYEYIGKGTNTQVKNIQISGGAFTSDASKEVFRFSDSFKNQHNSFVTGGKYSSDPSPYLETGYTANSEGNMFQVAKSTLKDVFFSGDSTQDTNHSIGKILFILFITIVLFVLGYKNRNKILNFLKK